MNQPINRSRSKQAPDGGRAVAWRSAAALLLGCSLLAVPLPAAENDNKPKDFSIINARLLDQLTSAGVIPVVAPIGFGVHDELTYNINADTSAGAIAGAIKARRLIFLTDVAGVLDKNGKLIPELTVDEVRALIADGTISGGMIPKVENCIDAVQRGVEAAVILDGRVPHALLLEIFTNHGVGTLIRRD